MSHIRLILKCETFEVFKAKVNKWFERTISKRYFAWQYDMAICIAIFYMAPLNE